MALAVMTNGTGDADEVVAVLSTGVLVLVDALVSCTGDSFGLVGAFSVVTSDLVVAGSVASRGVPQLIIVDVSESVFGESLSASTTRLLAATRILFAPVWVFSIVLSSTRVEVTGVVRIGSTTIVRFTGLVKSNAAS